ncbi:MAG: hypothetical protein CM15mP25_1420 [Gammaproteobacteria bacterium]|nr:MAG: hypothetical protein CM15mP25_1420 [Gammaproteobacteria bacterium]
MSSDSLALDQDTIAAIATPSGRGGVSIIRVSGPKALPIAELLTHKTVHARQPLLTRFLPRTMAFSIRYNAFFQSPASFTGEDVVEFHCHGGVMVTNLLLEACHARGARLARPGEFSERAFLNNKMDLTQAEGLADLIDAPTQQAARQATASLQGHFQMPLIRSISASLTSGSMSRLLSTFPRKKSTFSVKDGSPHHCSS